MNKILIIAIIFLVLVSCSSEKSKDTSLEIVSDPGKIFTFDDLKSIGYKKNRIYDISELKGATGAWYGFWGETRSTSKDYEVRIYNTHSDAVSMGENLAKEVTGDDAIITKEATWKEGIKDRRWGGFYLDGSIDPKYYGYIVYSNFIIFCEGREQEQSITRCSEIIKKIKK